MSDDDFIPTRGSKARGKNVETSEFQSITYNSYKPKNNKNNNNLLENNSTSKEKVENVGNELSMKKVKHEIVKFGMSGFDAKKKEEAKVQLAIKLGAKPRRNKCKNYKLLLKEKQKEKEEEKSNSNFQQLGKNSIGKSTAKGKGFDRKRKLGAKGKGGLLDVYGKVKINKTS